MNQFLEKALWVLLPALLSAVTYMWTTLEQTKQDVISLRVEAALEREKMRAQIMEYAAQNRERIATLEAQAKMRNGQ